MPSVAHQLTYCRWRGSQLAFPAPANLKVKLGVFLFFWRTAAVQERQLCGRVFVGVVCVCFYCVGLVRLHRPCISLLSNARPLALVRGVCVRVLLFLWVAGREAWWMARGNTAHCCEARSQKSITAVAGRVKLRVLSFSHMFYISIQRPRAYCVCSCFAWVLRRMPAYHVQHNVAAAVMRGAWV